MMFKKSVSRSLPECEFSKRSLLVLPLLLLQTSCTTFIPGLDRVLFSNSSAKVGPLVTVDEQYPVVDEDAGPGALKTEWLTEPVTVSEPVNSGESASTLVVETMAAEVAPSAGGVDVSPVKPQVTSANVRTLDAPVPVVTTAVAKKEKPETTVEYGAVTGTVVLIGEGQKPLSAGGTMITLTPKLMTGDAQSRPSQVHIIDMEDKEYQPRYSTVHAGDQVVFVNKDNIRHNVFSSSGNNAFDLGTYGAGLKRAVTLKEPGIVKIYCNIHADMATFVAVGNQGLSVKTDEQGRYRVGEVLPGAYELSIWNIRGETKRDIEVKADETIKLLDRIDTTAFKDEAHKNKFGGDYSKNSTLFKDEFY